MSVNNYETLKKLEKEIREKHEILESNKEYKQDDIKKAAKIIETLQMHGKLPKVYTKTERKFGCTEKRDEWEARCYLNTQKLLENYHDLKSIQKGLPLILREECELDKNVPDNIFYQKIIDLFELETEEGRLDSVYRGMRESIRTDNALKHVDNCLAMLKKSRDYKDYYRILKFVYIDNVNIGTEAQVNGVNRLLKTQWSKSNYYLKKKEAIRKLSLFLWYGENNENALMNTLVALLGVS
ncbi:MAG: hypothetical protein ACRCU3_02760 [Eubacteriaceae bacterium]